MQYFFGAAALAASATLVLAAPMELVGRDTIALDQVPAGQVFKSGPIHMQKTYNKYAVIGAVAPEDVQVAAQKASSGQQGSATANPQQYDEAYLVPVSVGGQTLNLDFDTGSSDLWVFSTVTPSSESTGHDLYNPSKSGTLKKGYSWKIGYGDGSGASGTVYSDKVVVGKVTATSQAVEAATSVSSTFTQDTANDGLLGLAFSSINTVTPKKQTTFFDTVKSSLAAPLFAADLKAGEPGSYQFGYIDSSKYTGDITYVDVDNSQGFWGFTAGDNIGSAIADTGTSLIYLPQSNVDAYYQQVSDAQYDQNQGGYTFSCNDELPDFTVDIGGTTFTVPGSYLNYAPTDSTGQTCFGGLQYNTNIGLSIFGDVFLKSVYAIFDETESSPRLGFAAQ